MYHRRSISPTFTAVIIGPLLCTAALCTHSALLRIGRGAAMIISVIIEPACIESQPIEFDYGGELFWKQQIGREKKVTHATFYFNNCM